MNFQAYLENLYISPLETCNLNCRYCYTTKTKNFLNNLQILDFVNRYRQQTILKSIILCGGEVFTLIDFPKLVNSFQSLGIFITIITNGTIDRLVEINDPKNCQLIVSFDGPQDIHDQNRGVGNFAKSLQFVSHALTLGFPVEIFYLVTKSSYPFIDTFKIRNLNITYLTDRLGSLTRNQLLNLKRNYPTYPAENFGCFTLALQSNGQVYGCCESQKPLGKISDPINKIITNFQQSLLKCSRCEAMFFLERNHPRGSSPKGVSTNKKSLPRHQNTYCSGCCDPTYLCGYLKELNSPSCPHVINLFR